MQKKRRISKKKNNVDEKRGYSRDKEGKRGY